MKIDFMTIKSLTRDANDLDAYIDDFLDNKCSPDDPPYISDMIVRFNDGGVYLSQALEARYLDQDAPIESRFKWKLRVIYDEWGNPVKPGDVVKCRRQKPLFTDKRQRKYVSSSEINADKIDGSYDKKWTRTKQYTVDEKGCITCEVRDATLFLVKWGKHGKSNGVLSQHKSKNSGEPGAAKHGDMKHVWYWRYEEVDRDMYKKLPVIEGRKKQKAS